MGVVAKTSESHITFEWPEPPDPNKTIVRAVDEIEVLYDPLAFEIQFGFGFDRNEGLGGAPQHPELWKIGIVQNVVYEKLLFRYYGLPDFIWQRIDPAVDALDSSKDKPFYGNSGSVTKPVREIWYSANGFSDRKPTIEEKALNNLPDFVNMWDQPSGGCIGMIKRKGDFHWIRRIEKIVSFQTWLVARKTGPFSTTPAMARLEQLFIPRLVQQFGQSTGVLAYVEPFTLRFWLQTDAPPTGFDMPAFTWGMDGVNGIVKTIFPGKRFGSRPNVSIVRGDGRRFPQTTGPTALERGRPWLLANGVSR